MRKQRKSLRPTLSIQGRRNTINIGIDVIRLLGEPTHVCIMRNLHNSSLAVRPCVAEDVMSFQVPDHFMEDSNAKFCIHSKQFVHQIMKECDLDRDKTYLFHGEWMPEKNAVIFMLKEQVGGRIV